MKAIFFIVVLVFSPIIYALDEVVEICAVQSHDSGDTGFIEVCGERDSKNQCEKRNWIVWDMSEGKGAAMYSTALTAFIAEKKVVVRFDGSSCINLYDKTSMIRIIK